VTTIGGTRRTDAWRGTIKETKRGTVEGALLEATTIEVCSANDLIFVGLKLGFSCMNVNIF
jgi:hypothetical protein